MASDDDTGPKRCDNATELRKGATGRPGGTLGGHAGGQKIKEASLLLSSATLLTWRGGGSTNAQIWIIILSECKYTVGQKFHLGGFMPSQKNPNKLFGQYNSLLGKIPGDSEGQGSLPCCGSWGLQESDTNWPLNNSNLMLLSPYLGNSFHHKTSSYQK